MGQEIERPAILGRMVEAAEKIRAVVDVAPLVTPEQEARAGEFLRQIKTLIAEGEKERKRVKAPYLKAGKEIDAMFRGPRRELERVEKLIKKRLAEAAEKRERERLAALEAQRQAEAEEVPPGEEEPEPVPADLAPLPSPAPGVSTRWRWEVESYDLDAVPPEYVVRSLDTERVQAEIRRAAEEGREPSVPGIVFRRTATVVARRLG